MRRRVDGAAAVSKRACPVSAVGLYRYNWLVV
jgi:hypothetical protein